MLRFLVFFVLVLVLVLVFGIRFPFIGINFIRLLLCTCTLWAVYKHLVEANPITRHGTQYNSEKMLRSYISPIFTTHIFKIRFTRIWTLIINPLQRTFFFLSPLHSQFMTFHSIFHLFFFFSFVFDSFWNGRDFQSNSFCIQSITEKSQFLIFFNMVFGFFHSIFFSSTFRLTIGFYRMFLFALVVATNLLLFIPNFLTIRINALFSPFFFFAFHFIFFFICTFSFNNSPDSVPKPICQKLCLYPWVRHVTWKEGKWKQLYLTKIRIIILDSIHICVTTVVNSSNFSFDEVDDGKTMGWIHEFYLVWDQRVNKRHRKNEEETPLFSGETYSQFAVRILFVLGCTYRSQFATYLYFQFNVWIMWV